MKRNIDMTNGPIFGGMVAFAIPLIFSGILQICFNLADQIVVSNFGEPGALASVGSTSSLIHLFVTVFIGLSVGAQVCISHNLGAGENTFANKHAHNAIATSVIIGVIVAVVGFFLAPSIIEHVMKTPKEALEGAILYTRVYLAGAPAILLYNYSAAVIKTQGDTKSPFIYLLIGGVANVLLNLLFVIVFKMSVLGVAVATVTSNVISAILCIWYLVSREQPCKISLRKIRIYPKEFDQIMKKGLPIALQSAAFSLSNVFIQKSVNSFGVSFVEGNAAAINICSFADVCNEAFGQSVLAFVGHNVGARNYKRVKKSIIVSLIFGFVMTVVIGTLIILGSDILLSVFKLDEVGIYAAKTRFIYLILPLFIANIMQVLSGAMRGMGKTLPPMILTVIGVCVFRLIWIETVFPIYNTPDCVYVSYPITWVLTVIGLIGFIIPEMKKLRKKLDINEA